MVVLTPDEVDDLTSDVDELAPVVDEYIEDGTEVDALVVTAELEE